MKYSVHDYAKALDLALADPKADSHAIGKNFLALVRRNGDEARLKKILDEAGRVARGKNVMREVVVESARPLSKPHEQIVKKLLKPHDLVRYAIDPSLVAGIKVVVNDEMQFDGSLKAKLDILFGV